MNLVTAWQGSPRRHHLIIRDGAGITELHDPRIVHHEKIKNRAQKMRIPRPRAQIICRNTGGTHEDVQNIPIIQKPAQRLQGEGLGGISGHLH